MLFGDALILVLFATAHASVSGYIGPAEEYKLTEILMRAFVKLQPGDVTTMYYGAKGFTTLKQPIPRVSRMDCCAHLQTNFKPDFSPESAFHALSAWSLLNCTEAIRVNTTLHNERTIQMLNEFITGSTATIPELRYTIQTMKLLNLPIPNPLRLAHYIQARLKEDDSLLTLGHALHAARELEHFGKFALDRVEDIVVQADEVDGRLLQWEGGLWTTGLLLTGLLNLPGAKPFNQNQADKFAAYLLSRRSVQSPRGALTLLQSAIALSNSEVYPICISIVGSAQIVPEKQELNIKISNLFGQPLKTTPTPVIAQSATRTTDDVVVMSKQPFSPTEEATVFKLPLRLEPGQYQIALSAGAHSTALIVRVLGPVTLQWLEIGLGDADGASAPRLTKLQFRSELPTPLKADSTHNLILKFPLSRPVQQAFLRLYSGKREIIFITERDSNQMYKANVNLASELAHSGDFEMELIIGDAIMSNPIRWHVGNVEVSLPTPEPTKTVKRGPKPEIKHLFRKPEARPPQMVSMLFTGLAAAPLLLLLVLWGRIGINLKNISFSSLPFHIGLGSILVLFGLFWWRYDMFVTCFWLVPLGGFTFLSGNHLLNKIAKQRK